MYCVHAFADDKSWQAPEMSVIKSWYKIHFGAALIVEIHIYMHVNVTRQCIDCNKAYRNLRSTKVSSKQCYIIIVLIGN